MLPDRAGNDFEFASPLALKDLEELRFYLEDYVALPVGEFGAKGERVANEKLKAWGEALFATVFGEPQRRDAYTEVRGALGRGERVEVAVRSENARFLALPWELLRAPGEEPLALRVAAFDRSLPASGAARSFADAGDGLRVLMVITRPHGRRDVRYQIIARPLFRQVESSKANVKIEVLRPPTFQTFRSALKAAKDVGRPYHVVHFDGHGTFGVKVEPAQMQSALHFYDVKGAPQGYLLFERADGSKDGDLIPATGFAEALEAGGVPVVVLNACRSGQIASADDAGAEASVATQLLHTRAASVVAMSHSVYAVAAAAFMTAFYEQLFQGKSVGEAVSEGRKALRVTGNDLRPSLGKDLPLQDWMVPVHYARASLTLPGIKAENRTERSAPEAIRELLHVQGRAGTSVQDPLAAEGGAFFGRDWEFFELEGAIRGPRRVVLHGVGGTGKTELAKGFARWLRVSHGIDHPGLVFFHSFEPGVATFGLDGVLVAILNQLGVADLYRIAPDLETRRQLVLKLLSEHRALLIWDNFESVASMPEVGQATPPLNEAGKEEIRSFVAALASTQSALIVTSRSREEWLGGTELVRLEVKGLPEDDAKLYASHLLSGRAAAIASRDTDLAPPRGAQSYPKLLAFLEGHPLSLRLMLPHLEKVSPTELLQGLQGLRALPAGFEAGAGRLQSLGASIYYSFRHLPPEDQARLPVLALFEQVVSAPVLGIFSDLETTPQRFRGLDTEGWTALLQRCAGLGLMSDLRLSLYRLHPALPHYLSAFWRAAAGEGHAAEREAALRSLIEAHAPYGSFLNEQIATGRAELAFALVRGQRAMLGAMLEAALERGMYNEAQAIIEPLDDWWNAAGLTAEAGGLGRPGDRRLRGACRRSAGDGDAGRQPVAVRQGQRGQPGDPGAQAG
jgi:hypothetical protein